jgi:hypothetical protein
MAEETEPVIGVSIGATTLAAVTADHALTREPVLTLLRNGSYRIGMPAAGPAGPETGLVFTDFVDRVGDATPVVASDGSARRGEQLLADGLRELACAATGGGPLPLVAVTHPAHWPPAAVYALRTALSGAPEWSQRQVSLTSDVAASLTALQANPGLPDRGIIAVCDFGGSGTSITLVNAAWGNQAVGATVRDTDFSGELLDRALLNYVMADLHADGSPDGGSGNGSAAAQRDQCRNVKEQLSANTVTELRLDLPGFHGGVWVTRAELDEAIRAPLDGFLDALQEALYRNSIPAGDLVAVAAVGGGANIPAITSGLSQRFGVEVISSPRPHLTAAIGAALGTARHPDTPAPAVHDTAQPQVPPPLAHEQAAPAGPGADHFASIADPVMPIAADSYPMAPEAGPSEPAAVPEPFPHIGGRLRSWNRRDVTLLVGAALAVLVGGIVAVIALRHASATEPEAPLPSVSTAPTSPAAKLPDTPMPSQPPVFPEIPRTLTPALETP